MGEKNPRKHISAENQKNHNHLINKGYLTYQVFTTSSGDAFVWMQAEMKDWTSLTNFEIS